MRTEVFQMEAKHVKDMMEAFVKELIENHKDIEVTFLPLFKIYCLSFSPPSSVT